jgi:hypothetical protein
LKISILKTTFSIPLRSTSGKVLDPSFLKIGVNIHKVFCSVSFQGKCWILISHKINGNETLNEVSSISGMPYITNVQFNLLTFRHTTYYLLLHQRPIDFVFIHKLI